MCGTFVKKDAKCRTLVLFEHVGNTGDLRRSKRCSLTLTALNTNRISQRFQCKSLTCSSIHTPLNKRLLLRDGRLRMHFGCTDFIRPLARCAETSHRRQTSYSYYGDDVYVCVYTSVSSTSANSVLINLSSSSSRVAM